MMKISHGDLVATLNVLEGFLTRISKKFGMHNIRRKKINLEVSSKCSNMASVAEVRQYPISLSIKLNIIN